MKYNWDDEIVTVYGAKIKFSEGGVPQTLRSITMTAVLQAGAEELKEEAKAQRHETAKKIRDADTDTDFTIPEVAAIKKLVGDYPPFGPIVAGPVFDLLEGK